MMRKFAVMAVTAVSLALAANAATTSVAVRGEAPVDGGFQLRQTVVHYGDLNVSSRQGASALLARLRKAAADTCSTSGMLSLNVKTEVKQCRNSALRHAVAKIDSHELSKMASAT